MTDDELTLLHRRIEEAIAAPLAVVTTAIHELERVRAQLEAELASYRGGPSPLDRRSNERSSVPVQRDRRRPPPALSEPIGINRPSFQS